MVKLKDFVRDALVQVTEGVMEAQKAAASSG
jgi:hypothetical protein